MKHAAKILSVALAACAALAIGASMTMSKGFDPQKWKAEANNLTSRNPRIGMVSDLQKILRVGMTKAEVLSLLGEPSTKKKTGAFVYDLGTPPFAVDLEYFILEFDEADKLKRFYIEQG
ncbi:outer membrane protein assembly factor BamE [Rhodomicrobium vannielii ATCC 17100]|uniref:outer membrane protein assembly factor BamE n=1 Tax=Rhodomicrobium vannielii TaxID=1069 RepID=UPI00191AFE65|nr:outer membrane protein assembly factor BamE [Rhodomicrobium vannielii]MBJ7532637.1 outer membrane protein assembly factor BamE [Rhodomicrobium vannielii ATCC 17100]